MNVYVIGAGGVGSWAAPALCMLVKPESVIIVDGDKLEKKNLNRQLFDDDAIGSFKASSLAVRYGCKSDPRYFAHGNFATERDDWLMCCVDNNPGRMAILETCDVYGSHAILASNETTSAEAYYYDPKWKGTKHDPRIYYPEIVTDKRFDPMRAAIGCTGIEQENNRQLVSANISAMSLMLQLFGIWHLDRRKFNREAVGYLPYRINANQTRFEVRTLNTEKE